jgi:predicted site-specific integrase-resolvase
MHNAPLPICDWLNQRELAQLLGVTERTASVWARRGHFRIYEHGVRGCGRRKYSRALLQHEIDQRWAEAVRRSESSDG